MTESKYGFGAPFVDVDEWRDAPRRHRYVHGGFEGTHTRFSFYLPPAEQYEGRFFQYLEGGAGGHEMCLLQAAERAGGWVFDLAFDQLGAYLVESNQGHFHNEGLGFADDIELFGASAESARYGKQVAADMYGAAPHHGYVWGPSGGGARTIACIENEPEVYDGASPHVIGGSGGAQSWSAWAYWWLHCRERRDEIVDAVEPGGSGDPFATLTTDQREALATLYRRGWPRGAENQLWSFASWMYPMNSLKVSDPTYYDDFWTKPGYLGHDNPERLAPLLVDDTFAVGRALSMDAGDGEILGAMGMARYEAAAATASGGPLRGGTFAITLDDGGDPQRLSMAKATVVSGKAAGREVYISQVEGDALVGFGLVAPDIFDDVSPGDRVHLDNRDYLAFCHLWRHAVDLDSLSVDDEATGGRTLATEFGGVGPVVVDGKPIFPQRPEGAHGRGNSTGNFGGKVIHVACAHDSMVWPAWIPSYVRQVRTHHGGQTDDHYRLWWVENAGHADAEYLLPIFTSEKDPGVWRSRLVDYNGVTSRALSSLTRWVEDGITPPRSTVHSLTNEGGIVLAESASARFGVQPMVRATANDAIRADVSVGEQVSFAGTAQNPPGIGKFVFARWDFEGTGYISLEHSLDDAEAIKVEATHAYSKPGTFFASFRVGAQADPSFPGGRPVENLARVRVVVT